MLPADAPGGADVPAPGGRPGLARRWGDLAESAHEPWAQAEIRRGNRAGAIRVAPAPGGGIRILPKDPSGGHA
jgi:hypothetical protein